MECTDAFYEKARENYRALHQHPELGFDLENTVALVKNELDALGISYTEQYGKGSVVAELGRGERLLALRADMDALPIEEKTDLPFKSQIRGKMHACGHDAHTAVLLSVAAYLKSVEERLACRVRLIFQPSEECNESGAKMMVDNGVMEGVDHILCTHCENTLESGMIGICAGDYMAACVPLRIRFFGKTAHATLRSEGADALAMAVSAYGRLEREVKALAGDQPYIWSVGRLSGGTAHNVVADFCEMDISFRFYDMDFAQRVRESVFSSCEQIAKQYGGRVEIDWNMATGPVRNDPEIVARFEQIAEQSGIRVASMGRRMSSEDFGWYLTKVRGMLFRFGTRNEAKGCTSLVHCNDFKIDEEGMRTAILAFVSYVMHFH